MSRFLLFALCSVLTAGAAGQEIRYVSDTQYVPLRSGQGSEYRIIHRGLPSGTRLLVDEVNEETGYSHVTTDRGTEGWILTHYLQAATPAKVALAQLREQHRNLQASRNELQSQLLELRASYTEVSEQLGTTRAALEAASSELAELMRVSGDALMLDSNNRELVQQAEVLKSRIEVMEADNQRLQESEESQAFLNGVFAVIIGVIITLVVPRLWPQRKSSSSWV